MAISVIAAISSNAALGNDNELLFHIKEDLKRFKELTKNQIVIQGRKTFDSIVKMNGRPLPNRLNVVMSRDENYESRYGEQVYTSIDRIINHHETMGDKDKKIFVIGGEQTYKLFLPYTTEIFLTHVNKHVAEVDSLYPLQLQEELGFYPVETSEDFYSEEYDAYYKFVRYVKRDVIADS